MKVLRRILVGGLCLAMAAGARAQEAGSWDDGTVPYVQTPMEIVERMLRMAQVREGDYLIDLGSGDGRIVIEAAKRGARALGVDLDPSLVTLAMENAKQAGVAERASFEVKDIFETDLSKASVVSMYLLPEVNAKLMPKLLELAPGTRIVSHDGGIGDWPADETLEMRVPEKTVGLGGLSRVELWIVPADASGVWVGEVPGHGGLWRFGIEQRYQVMEVAAVGEGREMVVRASRLRGNEIKLVVTGVVGERPWHHLFSGRIDGDRIAGELEVSDGNQKRTFPWNASRVR